MTATALPGQLGTPPPPPRADRSGALRLTWVQPEDLVAHELRQAVEDGRDPATVAAVAAAWEAAGGTAAPPPGGASGSPAGPRPRSVAGRLLDELAALTGDVEDREPTDLAAVLAACPDWPASPGGRTTGPAPAVADEALRPGGPRRDRAHPAPGSAPGPGPYEDALHAARTGRPAPGPGSAADATRAPAPDHARPDDPATAPATAYEDALHAAWLGRAAGCLLGKPVEKLPLAGIRALAAATGNWPLRSWFTADGLPPELARAHPWNRRSAPTSLAENIDGMPEDDDLNYPLLNLLLLRRYGRGFRTRDVAALWLDELPAGRTFTAERIAYRNLLCGIEPPYTARYRNPFREWIGAAIRADVHGWTHPGNPGAAAAQAHRDAVLSHTGNGVYAAMFIAATIARAAGGVPVGGVPAGRGKPGGAAHHASGPAGSAVTVHQALATGLTVVPPDSRLARAVRLGIATARAEADFDTVVDRLHRELGHYHWVHSVPNAALLAAALTHADGDFSGSICRAVSGGWDTDSNGATAGSVAGLLAGHPDRLPDRWTAPLRNRLASSVTGFDGIGFDALARLTHQEALRP
ncbi:ADP-ribosylglycohydrolase family protein [Streptomyces sp. NPDC020875]|uniref:ADP-ribosylglycohydrolase family protein n=1 Tax=Streptomyces sp. NPDC020875 TaxID=3154898 RepID=UPI0033FAB060